MSPRTKDKNTEIRQESMKKIMDAAFQLIAKQGYESTSISQLAKKAGVSKGLLYNYYTSKEDMLEKMILNAAEEGEKVIHEKMSNDPAKTLEGIFRYFFSYLKQEHDRWRMMAELVFKIDKFKFVHDLATEKIKAYLVLLESLLEQLGVENPKGEAKILAALFDGIGIQYLVIRDDYPLDELEKYLIHKYCKSKVV
jgi:AcrR family transcriptional regulator